MPYYLFLCFEDNRLWKQTCFYFLNIFSWLNTVNITILKGSIKSRFDILKGLIQSECKTPQKWDCPSKSLNWWNICKWFIGSLSSRWLRFWRGNLYFTIFGFWVWQQFQSRSSKINYVNTYYILLILKLRQKNMSICPISAIFYDFFFTPTNGNISEGVSNIIFC